MPSEALKKFAEELKAEREAKNITPQQIAHKTKIDVKFIRAIEEAKFDILPEIYVRAFIKEYALTVDLNPDEIIFKFDAVRFRKTEEKQIADEKEKEIIHNKTKIEETVTEGNNTPDQTSEIKKKFNLNFALGAVAATVVLILAYFLFVRESTPDIISEHAYESNYEEDKPAFEIDTIKNISDENNIIPSDSLQLTVNTFQRVWLKVLSDNKVRHEGMVAAKSKLTYNAFKEFRVVVGNAGNVNLTLNGKRLNDIGKTGEIRNLIINADTVKGYTLTPPTKNENQTRNQN